jgi:hypothetical protein
MQNIDDINPEKLDANKKKNNYVNNYAKSYPHFIRYFQDISEISEHHFFISTNFIYGWMPTIVSYAISRIPETIKYLNLVKSGHILTLNQLQIVKETINNSIIGTSKLLHFINPQAYAMWDSNICYFLLGVKSNDQVQKIAHYDEYMSLLRKAVMCSEFQKFYDRYRSQFKDPHAGKLRAIENVIFHLGKQIENNTK